ncbi:MAG: NTP transferase domain-containing protein [Anaerolineales bacterium]|nr:NTP transferase domain-containing protein [Anaerolineales bacterium]
MKAVILAGGRGTRLSPYTKILPKPLMPIGDMPILEVMLKQMKRAGITDVTLTVGHLANLLRTFFMDGQQWGMNISYSYEEKPLGTAGPLSLIEGLDSTFLVTNGDVLTTLDFRELAAFHKAQGGIATIAVHQRQVKIDLGVVQSDGGHRISGYIEKPTYDYTVSMGIYVFEPQVLKFIPHNVYLDFPELVLKLIAAGEKVVGYPFDGYWMDLGRPDDYAQAAEDFASMREQFLPEE